MVNINTIFNSLYLKINIFNFSPSNLLIFCDGYLGLTFKNKKTKCFKIAMIYRVWPRFLTDWVPAMLFSGSLRKKSMVGTDPAVIRASFCFLRDKIC